MLDSSSNSFMLDEAKLSDLASFRKWSRLSLIITGVLSATGLLLIAVGLIQWINPILVGLGVLAYSVGLVASTALSKKRGQYGKELPKDLDRLREFINNEGYELVSTAGKKQAMFMGSERTSHGLELLYQLATRNGVQDAVSEEVILITAAGDELEAHFVFNDTGWTIVHL